MIERNPSQDDTIFEQLIAQIELDPEHSDDLVALDGDFALLDARNTNPITHLDHPHLKVSINEVSELLPEAFSAICAENGIDPQDPDDVARHYELIGSELSTVLYSLRDTFRFGDVIGISAGCVFDMSDDGALIGVDENTTVYGVLTAPTVGPVPNEMQRITGDYSGDGDFDMGVGIILANPVRVDSDGERHTDEFIGKEICVPLGLAGLQVTKISLTDTIPSDNEL